MEAVTSDRTYATVLRPLTSSCSDTPLVAPAKEGWLPELEGITVLFKDIASPA